MAKKTGFDCICYFHYSNLFSIGPACSPAANPIARDVIFKNIQMVSYAASSTELSDNTTFRNFYRVIPSELVLVQARVNFVLQQGWRRVGEFSKNVTFIREPD